LLREVPGQVAVEPVVDAVTDGGGAAQLGRGEDADEVVGDGLEVPGAARDGHVPSPDRPLVLELCRMIKLTPALPAVLLRLTGE
jgi:hypothetical protein